jgi:hypothetical protein
MHNGHNVILGFYTLKNVEELLKDHNTLTTYIDFLRANIKLFTERKNERMYHKLQNELNAHIDLLDFITGLISEEREKGF